jgi:hypothetical protein
MLRSIYPYDGADETLGRGFNAYLNRLRGGACRRRHCRHIICCCTCRRPHRRSTPTSSNANIELERKAIGNVSRAMHLSDEDEEDDDGDAAHQAGDSLLSIVNAW